MQANDVTADLPTLQAELDTSHRLQELLADLAVRLINQPAVGDPSDEIERAQRRLCDLLGFDRSTLWYLTGPDGETLRLRRIVQPETAPVPPQQMNATEHFPYLVEQIQAGAPVLVARLADLPAAAEQDRKWLAHYQAKSTAVFPLRAGGRVFAAITFATVYAERAWTPALVQRLELVAQVFAAALARSDANEALREVTVRLINAQEKERARLARELHDGMSQQLAVLAVELQLLGLRPPATTAEMRARLDELSDKTKALSSDVHRMSHALHPAKLEQLGLVAAIGGFCRELDATAPPRVQFTAERVPERIPSDRALALYRVAQESLWNVVRHSGATHATVSLAGAGSELLLDVADDGCGFDPDAVAATASMGLLGMRERISVLGGRIRWDAAPGRGTAVRVRLPLSPLPAS